MLVKYCIEIDGVMHDVPQDGLKNWDEIICRYNRASFGSVSRAFSSAFEFVNGMYELMLDLYKRDGINAKATIHLYTITNRWEWEESFVSPLDFTTASWDKYIFYVNCVDSNLAALIKANKSTKFEFLVGDEVPTSAPLEFDRIPMVESVEFQVMGDSNDEDASMKVFAPGRTEELRRARAYALSPNININGVLDYEDQSGDNDGFIAKAIKDVKVTVSGGIAIDLKNSQKNTSFSILIYHKHDQGSTGILVLGSKNDGIQTYDGDFATPSELPTAIDHGKGVAYVQNTDSIWEGGHQNGLYVWEDTGRSYDDYMYDTHPSSVTVEMKAGDTLWIGLSGRNFGFQESGDVWAILLKQEIKISWAAEGKPETIDTITPKKLCKKLLDRMCMGSMDIDVQFSDHDPRLANTYLMAAESIRDIPQARIYSSFNEFTDFMSTVFGYTFYLGPLRRGFANICNFIGNTPDHVDKDDILDEPLPNANLFGVYFHKKKQSFLVWDMANAVYYRKWPGGQLRKGSSWYNDRFGYARKDVLFRNESTGTVYELDRNYDFIAFNDDLPQYNVDKQSVIFVHRSEIFNANAEVRKIKHAKEVNYSVDDGCIYSSVTIGYDKKDYEGFNGRDEFNFNNTYSTGHDVNEKSLSLISKYRADCYGIEFAVQKRAEKTTDSSSDNDIFFILTTTDEDGKLVPDRSMKIENAISDKVFNGAFSPMACLKANAGMIGVQENNLHLEYASSTGNSSIVIDGVSMTDSFDLGEPYMSCGIVSFTTDDVDDIADVNQLVEFENGGIKYRGFVESAEFKYAVDEAVEYTLLVKDFEICF